MAKERLDWIQKRGVSALVAVTLVGFCAHAEEPTYVIVGARIFVGDQAGTILDRGTVWIASGRVVEVTENEDVTATDGVVLIDGKGRTLLPGLIDAHVHLFGSGGPFERQSDEFAPLRAEQSLACGVTTLLDLHAPEAGILSLRAEARRFPGRLPRILTSGLAITVPGGHGTEGGFPARLIARPEDVVSVVADLVRARPDVVKVMFDPGGWGTEAAKPTLTAAELAEIIVNAHAADLKVVVHALRVVDVKVAIRAGADAIAHAPLQGEIDDELIALFVDRQTVLIPTLAVYASMANLRGAALSDPSDLVSRFVDPRVLTRLRDGALSAENSERVRATDATWRSETFFQEHLAAVRSGVDTLHRSGVRIVAGTDAGNPGTFHGEALHRELEELVRAGFSPSDALLTATREAARFLGPKLRVGTIERGWDADLILVKGNPLTKISATREIEEVFHAGRRVDRERVAARTARLGDAGQSTAGIGHEVVFDFDGDGDSLPPHELVTDQGDSTGRVDRVLQASSENGTPFLRLRGSVVVAPPAGGYVGVLFRLGTEEAPRDVSKFGAIRFRARSSVRTQFRVEVRTTNIRDGDHFGAPCVATPTWSWYVLPFEDLGQIGFGRRARFDASRVTSIGFFSSVGHDGEFELDIDDVGWSR